MNKDTTVKIALGVVIVAFLAAVMVLTYMRITGSKEDPILLSETDRATVMTATLPGPGTTMSDAERDALQSAVLPQEAKPVVLSPDERRALIEVSEQ
jgi:hypothetical protein